MADYYAILTKAVSALPQSTGEARRDVYEKARKALVSQLQLFEPPLPPSEITSQRLTLEEAIRKVEAEAARATLGIGRSRAAEKPAAPAPSQPGETAKSALEPKTSAKLDGPDKTKVAGAYSPAVAGESAAEEAKPAAPKLGKGVDMFRRAVAEADNLGAASSEASRAAREVLDAAAEETRSTERHEPDFEPIEGASKDAELSDAEATPGAEPVVGTDTERAGDDADDLINLYEEGVAQPLSSRTMWLVAIVLLLLIFVGAGAFLYSQRDFLFAGSGETVEPVAEAPVVVASEPEPPKQDENGLEPKITDRLPTAGGSGGAAPDARTVRTLRVVAPITSTQPSEEQKADVETAAPGEEEPRVITGEETPSTEESSSVPLAPVVSPQGDASTEETVAAETPSVEVVEVTPETPATEAPAASTIAATDNESAPAANKSSDVVLVGQRAILYEEGRKRGTSNKAYIGNVTWKLEQEPVNDGTTTDTVLIAHAEIPERGFTIDIKIRPNRDKDLPASHSIEIGFELPNEFSGKGIGNVPGLILKTTEQARGDALRGASTRVLDNLFWIALSEISSERENNEKLLKNRGWIDIPLLYLSDQRAILTLEKGAPGDAAIEEAFKRWKAS